MAEPIEILFQMLSQVDSRKRVLDRGRDPPMQSKGTILRGEKWRPIVRYRDSEL